MPWRAEAAINADFDRLGSDAVPSLVRSLGDPSMTIRYLAAGQLGRRKDARATPALIASLDDREAVVRKWAAGALGDIADRRAVARLIRCLEDVDGGVRFVAADALGKIGDIRAVEPLIAPPRRPTDLPRAYAATALGALGDERAIPALTRAATQDDSWVAKEAKRSLERSRRGLVATRADLPRRGVAGRHKRPALSSMADRGYTLIDFTVPQGVWPDRDRVVRFMEYVRANFRQIVSSVPAGCEIDLFASGHAHNPGLVPLLGLWAPAAMLNGVPPPEGMIDEVNVWCSGLSRDEVEAVVAGTIAPTWKELVRAGVHPVRERSA
jgi:hypothetical protein